MRAAGDAFDVRVFHEALLGHGPVPLRRSRPCGPCSSGARLPNPTTVARDCPPAQGRNKVPSLTRVTGP